MSYKAAAMCSAIVMSTLFYNAAQAADQQVERGKYLVATGGCHDCHTPGYFLGHEQTDKFLGGSDIAFSIPGLGVFRAPNLTPDSETGIGQWSTNDIVTAITTGKIPNGRTLAPIMPWENLSHLTAADAMAIAVYLKTIPPIKNEITGPFGPSQKPDVPTFIIPAPGRVHESGKSSEVS
jgi:mono/diheme cytochrome c family protein